MIQADVPKQPSMNTLQGQKFVDIWALWLLSMALIGYLSSYTRFKNLAASIWSH